MNTDITPPGTIPSGEQPKQAPVMDVQRPAETVPAPAPAPETKEAEQTKQLEDTKPAAAPKPAKVPKQPGSGVGFAIAATVVIVLGLAVLATYAYLKTK